MRKENDLNKEKNFISAVVYLRNNGEAAVSFFETLNSILNSHFEKYELIAVNNSCEDQTVSLLRDWSKTISCPLTVVSMSIVQDKELCMNAGIDASIGDYIYEFDSVEMPYDPGMIFQAYQTATQGNDIVSVCPSQMKLTSKIFYSVFNRNSRSAYTLRSAAFRLVTRRAINRVHATSGYLPYRKAAFAASGLKAVNMEFSGRISGQKERIPLAIDSLILYTEAGFKISRNLALFMIVLTLAELIYSVAIYCVGYPVEGWTTTMLVVTLGFSGLFCLLTVIIKYLSILIELVFKKQKYFVESVEKIQK